MLVNTLTAELDLENIRVGDFIVDGLGVSGKVIKVLISRYATETHYYFSVDNKQGTILVIK